MSTDVLAAITGAVASATTSVSARLPASMKGFESVLSFASRALSYPLSEPAPSPASIRWVVIQVLVVWFFWRLFQPFLASTKMSRGYRHARMAVDAWLFTALVVHVPAFNATADNAPSRLFLGCFVFFLVCSHVAMAMGIGALHWTSWLVNGLVLTVPWLPAGQAWRGNGLQQMVRLSIAASLLASLGLLSCALQAAPKGHSLCVLVPDLPRARNTTQVLDYVSALSGRLGLVDLAPLSLHRESPIGLLWLSALSLALSYWTLNRSSALSAAARMQAALAVLDAKQRLEKLRRLNNESEDQTRPADSGLQPRFMPMSEWYSLTVVDAAVQLLVSLKIFFGRFDFRALQTIGDDSGPLRVHAEAAQLVDEDGCFWFDWLADTGDGGDSTYHVARLAARRALSVAQQSNDDDDAFVLARPPLLVIGGDLCYPTPSIEGYDARLFTPFGYALEGPQPAPLDATGGAPLCFAIPGNHDYLDGMFAFSRCLLDRDWLGGWRLPQRSTYFALQLPHGWWLFGLDQALNEDIDGRQLRYFARVMKEMVGPSDRVIVATHEPVWALDAYARTQHRSPMLEELLAVHVGARIGLRIAGDVHNYMRYARTGAAPPASAPVLVVSGGGGAFLHPTHPFPQRLHDMSADYEMAKAFPDVNASRQVALENLGSGFRVHNWGFDMFGAALYFFIVVSLFPRCGVRERILASAWGVTEELAGCVADIFATGNVSLFALVAVVGSALAFSDAGGRGGRFRIALGLSHGVAHVVAALALFIVLEFTVETALNDGLVAAQPSPWYWRLLDLPEAVGFAHRKQCAGATLSRFELWLHYLGSFLYTYVLSADMVAIIIGIYLFVSGGLLGVHWNEAYSSVRCQHWKSFCRFKIDPAGTLHCFAIGIERVPSHWRRAPNFKSLAERMAEAEVTDPLDEKVAAYGLDDPSEWAAASKREEEDGKATLVDYFTCVFVRRVTGVGPGY